MSSALVLVPFIGVGIGIAAAYGVTHKDRHRRIHFVERENLEEELDSLDITLGGEETCPVCGEEVSPGEVGALVRDNGHYKVIHDRPSCLDSFDLD